MKARLFFNMVAVLALLALALGTSSPVQAGNVGPCGPNVTQKRGIFTIIPSGGDDTAALQCALDQATAYGSGAVVQLAAGDFHTSFLKASGFNGVFKGKGMDVTRLIALDDLRCDLEFEQGIYPRLITFTTTKAQLSDLSILVPDPTPCVLPLDEEGNEYNPYWQGNSLGMAVSFSAPFADECNVNEVAMTQVVVDSVAIEGQPGGFGDPEYYTANLVHGIVFGSDSGCPYVAAHSGGSFKLTRSRISQAALPVGVFDLKRALVQIGGNAKMGNTFTEMGDIYMYSNIGGLFDVSYNLFDNVYWEALTLWVDAPAEWQQLVDEPANYLIHHNTMNLIAGSTGLYIEDSNIPNGLPAGMHASITNNQINFNGFYHWGVFARYANNFILANNTFVGTAELLAWIGRFPEEGIPATTASYWLIKNNNVSQAQFNWAAYIFRATSANNVLIGTGQEFVIDEGTDNVIRNVLEPAAMMQESRMAEPEAPSKAPKTNWK